MVPRVKSIKVACFKKHAERSSQNSKRSHMVQVMAQNHFGALAAKTGPNVGGQGAYVAKEEQVTYLKSGFYFSSTGRTISPQRGYPLSEANILSVGL